MSFKSITWKPNEKPDVNDLEQDASDAPDLILMEFIGFGVRQTSKVKKTKANDPRKENRIQKKICRYLASWGKGVGPKSFPPSLVVHGKDEELFDGRHTLEVLITLCYLYYWFALWEIKECGIPMFDNLTRDQKISLCGLRMNSLNKQENTVEDDYIRLIRKVMQDADIPFISKNIIAFMELTGVYECYQPASPSFAKIENAIKKQNTSTNLIFNTSEKELREYMKDKNDPAFLLDNQISFDGYVCGVRKMNKTAHKRYAADIVRTAVANFMNGNKTRIVLFGEGDDKKIENERQDIINEIYKQFVSPINFYGKWLNDHSLIKCDYPLPSIQDLGLQVFASPQITGETSFILLESK